MHKKPTPIGPVKSFWLCPTSTTNAIPGRWLIATHHELHGIKLFFWDKANPKTLKRAKEMKKIIKKSFVRRSTFKKGSCKKKNECHYTFCCFHGFVPDVIYPCAAMNDVTLRILTFGTRNLVHKVRPLLLLLTTSEFWNYIKRSLKICFKLWSCK